MKKLLILLFITSCTILTAQEDEPSMIFDTVFRYFEGTEEPPANWNQVGFDYSDWDSVYFNQFGHDGIIGYGHDNDSVLLNTVISFYCGMTFTVNHKELLTEMFLFADYDDGYIAYINGNEIARINMGDTGTYAPYNQLADRSSEISEINMKPGIFLDEELLQRVLIPGRNVLSFQVHNDSINGSDIGFNIWLQDYSGMYFDVHQWYGYKQIELDSTHLPIVKIEVDEGAFDSNFEKYNASMQIIQKDSGYNHTSDTTFDFSGSIAIEVRGQSSSHWPKKNYTIETRDSLGENLNIELLGMPRENDWVLYGPFSDRSLIRNALAFSIAQKLPDYAPRFRYVNLVMNDEFLGVYCLMEKIKRDRSRVDLKKLTEDDDDITGGYILKWDKVNNGNPVLQIVYPNDITEEQEDYIMGFYNDYKATLAFPKDSFLNPEIGYRKYIARPSFIDYTIVNELAKNCDVYRFSTYMYKDVDSIGKKLHYGPVWDFDLAFGNTTFQHGDRTYGWQFAEEASNSRPDRIRYSNPYLHHVHLFRDTAFVHEFQDRWRELREGPLMMDSIFYVIDSLREYIGDEAYRNFDIWPMEGKHMGLWGFSFAYTYEEEYHNLKNWIEARVAWIDNNIDSIYYPFIVPAPEVPQDTATGTVEKLYSSIVAYPNPVVNILSVAGTTSKTTELQVEIIDLFGQILKRESFENIAGNTFDEKINVNDLSSGMYYVKVYSQNKLLYVEQIVKR